MVKKYNKKIIQIMVKRGRKIYLDFGNNFEPIIPLDMEWIYKEIIDDYKIYDMDIIDILYRNCNNLKITKNCIIFVI